MGGRPFTTRPLSPTSCPSNTTWMRVPGIWKRCLTPVVALLPVRSMGTSCMVWPRGSRSQTSRTTMGLLVASSKAIILLSSMPWPATLGFSNLLGRCYSEASPFPWRTLLAGFDHRWLFYGFQGACQIAKGRCSLLSAAEARWRGLRCWWCSWLWWQDCPRWGGFQSHWGRDQLFQEGTRCWRYHCRCANIKEDCHACGDQVFSLSYGRKLDFSPHVPEMLELPFEHFVQTW